MSKNSINWYFHTDNNLLYYDNRSLAERFPEKDKRWKDWKTGGSEGIKSILRGNIETKIHNAHILNRHLLSCDGFGRIKTVNGIITNDSDHYYNYIDHYWAKSTEEFVNKLAKGSVAVGFNVSHAMRRINIYFSFCDLNLDKINYIENKTKLNLTEFRLKLHNKKNMTN